MYRNIGKSARTLSAILASLLLLASCGGNGDAGSGSSQEPSSTPSASESSTESESNSTEMKPVTIRIMGPANSQAYWDWNDRESFPSYVKWQEELARRNLTLNYEIVSSEQYGTVVQTRMAAATDLPDLINLTPLDDVTALNLGVSGQLQDWIAAMDTYSRPDPLEPTNRNGDPTLSLKDKFSMQANYAKKLVTAPDGKMYWCPDVVPGGMTTLPDGSQAESLEVIGAAIRSDWLAKVNKEMPTTVDEFLDVLRAFQAQDVNGNGQKDERYCFDAYSYGFFTGIAQWFGLTPGLTGIDPNTDSATSAWYSEGVRPYFELLSTMVKEDLFDTSMLGATDEMFNSRIAENKVAGMRSYTDATWFNQLVEGVEEAEYTVIAPIQAVEGITPYLLTDAAKLCYNKMGITKAATPEVVEGIIRLYDFSFTETASTYSGSGIEGTDYIIEPDPNNEGRVRLTQTDDFKAMTPAERYEARRGGCSVFSNIGIARIDGGDPSIVVKGMSPEERLANLGTDKQRRALENRWSMMTYRPYVVSPFSSSTYAVATEEEQEILTAYTTALQSYSDELCMNLILGNVSLDQLDAEIEKLNELGLDKVVKVNNDRYERYKNN